MAYILIQGWPGEGVLRVLPRADPGLQPFDELLAVQGEHTEVVRLSLRAARRQGVRISVKVRGDERNFSIEHCTSGVPWLKTVVVFDHIFVYRLTRQIVVTTCSTAKKMSLLEQVTAFRLCLRL